MRYSNMKNTFNAKQEKNRVVKWIREWFNNNGKGCKAVIGVSGGADSSVVAALCVEALGKENVVGVLMPNGAQRDISYSKMLVEHLRITNYTINVAGAFNSIVEELKSSGIKQSEQSIVNLSPRLRMSILYAVSQSVSGRVANTCNLSEDWIGFSTRYGDSVGDFSPLSLLTKTEVCLIGEELNLPKELVYKVPSDGLTDKTDEDAFGFTYFILDRYIRTGICEDANIKELIDRKHRNNLFKLKLMPSYIPSFDNISERLKGELNGL